MGSKTLQIYFGPVVIRDLIVRLDRFHGKWTWERRGGAASWSWGDVSVVDAKTAQEKRRKSSLGVPRQLLRKGVIEITDTCFFHGPSNMSIRRQLCKSILRLLKDSYSRNVRRTVTLPYLPSRPAPRPLSTLSFLIVSRRKHLFPCTLQFCDFAQKPAKTCTPDYLIRMPWSRSFKIALGEVNNIVLFWTFCNPARTVHRIIGHISQKRQIISCRMSKSISLYSIQTDYSLVIL